MSPNVIECHYPPRGNMLQGHWTAPQPSSFIKPWYPHRGTKYKGA
nr:MAG TPA: hypothetical protein [Caudoviricetes sp.]